jgi:hypothetical protein
MEQSGYGMAVTEFQAASDAIGYVVCTNLVIRQSSIRSNAYVVAEISGDKVQAFRSARRKYRQEIIKDSA